MDEPSKNARMVRIPLLRFGQDSRKIEYAAHALKGLTPYDRRGHRCLDEFLGRGECFAVERQG